MPVSFSEAVSHSPLGFVTPRDGGERIVLPDWTMRVTVPSSSAKSTVTLIEGEMGPGSDGPPPHVHAGHDEIFVVLAGRLRFRIGDVFHTSAEGETVFAGRNLAHGFANPFDVPARYILLLSPSGYENYFRELSKLIADATTVPARETITTLMARYRTVPATQLVDPGDGAVVLDNESSAPETEFPTIA